MKQVIRLTESELVNLVKRIIKEKQVLKTLDMLFNTMYGNVRYKKDKLQGWGLLLAMTHKHETYDFFKIPKYTDEVDEYYRNNPIVFDTNKGVSVKKSKQK